MRSRLRHLRFLGLLALPALLAACPGTVDDGPPSGGSLVVGVQSDDFGGAVGPVHIVTKVDGAVQDDETVDISTRPIPGQPPGPLPKEILVEGAPGANVEVSVEGFSPGGATGAPVISRVARTRLPADKRLLRIQLQTRCFQPPGSAGPGVATCAATQTCLAGQCVPIDVAAADLEDYEPGWAAAPPDICRPARHGAPEVVLGTGQTDYGTLAEGQVLQLEKGPQGGHHIWIAVRMRNLRQSGSTTTVSARFADDPAAAPVPPSAVIFTFDPDEGAYCKIYGIRYQVDTGASDLRNEYKRFLGKRLAVTVEVADSTGARASSTRTVQIADKLLCPDGTDSCNVP